jgi:hypothetical protein
MSNKPIEVKKEMVREFEMLIDRCGCSRASITITPEEAKRMTEEFTEKGKYPQYKIDPVKASCTPERCFPELVKFLYPNNTCKVKSHLIKNRKKAKYCL